MSDALLLGTLGASAVGLVSGAVLTRPQPQRQSMAWRFPTDLTSEQVEAVLNTVASLPGSIPVTFTVDARPETLAFTMTATASTLRLLEAALRGVAPGVRTDPIQPEALAPTTRVAIVWGGRFPLLRTDTPETASAALLGVLRNLYRGERVEVRVHLRPAGRVHAPLPARSGSQQEDVLARWLFSEGSLPADQLRAVRTKYATRLLRGVIEVEITAATTVRARQLQSRIVTVLRTRTGARGHLTTRRLRLQSRRLPRTMTVFNAAEAVGLLGLPIAAPVLPGLEYSRAPQLLPSARIPSSGIGRRFATSTWPGMEKRALVQPVTGSLSHSLIVGPTGSGKSVLTVGLVLQDMAAGRGALLLDMKGDTVTDVLQRIPADRQRDVVLLDPSAGVPLPGIKGLGSGDPELNADLWLGIFRGLFADSWGVRTERYLRLGLLTVTRDPSAAITDLPRVFSDRGYRAWLVGRANDPLLGAAWARLDALSPAQTTEHIAAPLGKVQDVISRRVVRGVVGQSAPRITIRQAIRQQKLVLVRLSPGQLGGPAAQLLGALVVYETYQAMLERVKSVEVV